MFLKVNRARNVVSRLHDTENVIAQVGRSNAKLPANVPSTFPKANRVRNVGSRLYVIGNVQVGRSNAKTPANVSEIDKNISARVKSSESLPFLGKRLEARDSTIRTK
jgi:hypothetical protein